ncbi:MAG: heme NO-binding domain-containing protein [Bacteroidetes bacterium]|nr:heme NO-binding domain-containing protein [Bacteroidota bacterium]
MKGIVFTEFFQFIEDNFGYEMVDELIEETQPASGGIYTAVGSYPFNELVSYLTYFCKKKEMDPALALRLFGHHLFNVFSKNYQQFFKAQNGSFGFLASIDNHIHVEVAKLYPDAELPKFNIISQTETEMVMHYTSERKLHALAHGLIEKTLEHYHQKGEINTQVLGEDGSQVQFKITLK